MSNIHCLVTDIYTSDTTASALTILFVLLATHPSYQQKLREEVAISFADATYNCGKPQALLDGILMESLRLFPPVTFSSQRVVPPGGLTVGKVYLPEDTVVSIGTYQVQHGIHTLDIFRECYC
jgi:cytochrome P450